MHDWPHFVSPGPHALEQFPFEHTSPILHLVPQLPQFCGSDPVAAHVAPQRTVPPLHPTVHMPIEQSSPCGHCFPHMPQLFVSRVRIVQLPLQLVDPLPHFRSSELHAPSATTKIPHRTTSHPKIRLMKTIVS